MDAGTSVEDAMKNLKIDSAAKASNLNLAGSKDRSPSDVTSCISSGDASSSIKESEVDQEGLMSEQSIYYPVNEYYGYYYPGFFYGEWDGQNYTPGNDDSAIPTDNTSFTYYFPGIRPGYASYPILPETVISADGQYVTQQPYYPSSIFPQTLIASGYFPQSVTYGPEFVPLYWDPSLYTDGIHSSGLGFGSTITANKPKFPSHTKASICTKSVYSDMKKGYPHALDISPAHKQSLKPSNKAGDVLSTGFLPINKLHPYANQGKSGIFHAKETGRSWVRTEKLKERSRNYVRGSFHMLNEQNRGPRKNGTKNTLNSGIDQGGSSLSEENEKCNVSVCIRNKEYNLPDFPTNYDHAFFFVIKSHSEDDIHKSIKYNVWASTTNGNKRLDNAYQTAQEEVSEKGTKCPVFLLFSVNASGQFCGIAEMIGRVDFSKNMDFWQQDKWTGFFPVKWHIIKDIPNKELRHILLEKNENKPVTSSRDAQEVKFRKGTEMLNIFKNYYSKTSILDDFDFYENRQKLMQEKKIKKPAPTLAHILPKSDGSGRR